MKRDNFFPTLFCHLRRRLLQAPEHRFYGLQDKILLFKHDAKDANVLRMITNPAQQVVDGTLVEVVLSGKLGVANTRLKSRYYCFNQS